MSNEAAVQQAVRLEYARRGYRLFRNNSGALPDARGVPVRFGLGNDSTPLNKALKSSDLIGWHPRVVTQDMVGCVIAQFVSLEIKPSDWRPALSGERFDHEEAQRRWLDMVVRDGGQGRFMTGVDQ